MQGELANSLQLLQNQKGQRGLERGYIPRLFKSSEQFSLNIFLFSSSMTTKKKNDIRIKKRLVKKLYKKIVSPSPELIPMQFYLFVILFEIVWNNAPSHSHSLSHTLHILYIFYEQAKT